jgi:hypothetical protein
MDAREEWIARHADEIRRVLSNGKLRTELLALLGGDNHQAKRRQRLAELEEQVNGMELTLRLRSDDACPSMKLSD